MKVYRQQIPIVGECEFAAPGLQAVLSVAPGRGGYYIDMWYLVDETSSHSGEVAISVAGTGHPLRASETLPNYVGTCVMPDGLVWHVFAERK